MMLTTAMPDADDAAESVEKTLLAGRYYGVYPAVVTDNQDPNTQGRVKVRLPWSPDASGAQYEVWARIATTMAGNNRGTWFIPDPGDEVLVSFHGGDTRWPYIIGGLWNGKDAAPQSMNTDNTMKAIVSRTGITISMDDTAGAATLVLTTPNGQKLTLTDAGSTVTVADSNGNTIELAPGGITLTSSGPLQVNAPTATCDFGMLTVNSAMSMFSGVVQCDTLISNAVVGASYTPGVGNVW
jgi:uncharacterized protein involved in type VI secretion and phage assembly